MARHWKGIFALFILTLSVFGAAIATGSMYFSIVALLLGFVLAFILGTAWMRPKGSPKEHHSPIDRVVNDTRP